MKVSIYGKPNCKYCDMAKQICEQNNIAYDYKIVGGDLTVEQLQEMVNKPVRTVPQIFVNSDGFSEHVGGYNELNKYIQSLGQ